MYFLPVAMLLGTLPVCMYSLLIENILLFAALVGCLIYRLVGYGTYGNIRRVLIGVVVYCFVLLAWKTISKIYNNIVWLDRSSLQILFLLVSLNIDLTGCDAFHSRVQ